jgi:hypothetical protein
VTQTYSVGIDKGQASASSTGADRPRGEPRRSGDARARRMPTPMHPARRRDLRPWRRACRQQWQVSWLADQAQPACLPGEWPSGAWRVALRLQLRGQPRRRTAFPFHLPHGRTITCSCMTGCVTGQSDRTGAASRRVFSLSTPGGGEGRGEAGAARSCPVRAAQPSSPCPLLPEKGRRGKDVVRPARMAGVASWPP